MKLRILLPACAAALIAACSISSEEHTLQLVPSSPSAAVLIAEQDLEEPFDQHQAVAAVLKEHPGFPQANETEEIETVTGGPAPGSTVTGTLHTSVEATSETDTYTVTLSKRWNLIFNGEQVEGHWTYAVTPDGIELVDSADNTELVTMIK